MITKPELVFEHCSCEEPGIDTTREHHGKEVVVSSLSIVRNIGINTTSCENHLPNYLKAGWSIVE